MKENKGVTLLALVITIIILLLLAGVTTSLFGEKETIENAESALEQGKVEATRAEIELAISKKMIIEDNDVTIEQIIKYLEKQGIVNEGDGNPDNGQVKTQPDGYIYEIRKDENGKWEVEYVGNGEMDKSAITISVTGNTTQLTSKVTLTIKGSSLAGITKYTPGSGTEKTYANGTTKIEETCEITANGTYTFTIKNKEGKTASKTITINNILTGIITISATPTTITKDNVTITVTWPSGTSTATKQISIDGGTSWNTYTGDTSTVTVSSNCTVKARIMSGTEEIKTTTLTINNIDKNPPTVTAVQTSVEVYRGVSNDLNGYFTITANGSGKITSTEYVNTTDNSTLTNTNTLSEGTHIIKCTVTKETGATASATITIVVKQVVPVLVDGETVILTKDNVKDYLGKVVISYKANSEESEPFPDDENGKISTTYRLFYVDFDGKYGMAGAVYLKADVPDVDYSMDIPNEGAWSYSYYYDGRISDSNASTFIHWQHPSIPQTRILNSYWINMEYNPTGLWLTNSAYWSAIGDPNYAESIQYIAGAPSLEMFIDSYNTYYSLTETNENSERAKLFYEIDVENVTYKIGVDGERK